MPGLANHSVERKAHVPERPRSDRPRRGPHRYQRPRLERRAEDRRRAARRRLGGRRMARAPGRRAADPHPHTRRRDRLCPRRRDHCVRRRPADRRRRRLVRRASQGRAARPESARRRSASARHPRASRYGVLPRTPRRERRRPQPVRVDSARAGPGSLTTPGAARARKTAVMPPAHEHPGHLRRRENGHVTAVVHVGGLHYASEKAVVEGVLANRPGVTRVEANPVAQTATVEYDPEKTSVETLHKWVEECGYHCAGRSTPGHVCDPLAEEDRDAPVHAHAAVQRADDADGHGHGGHAGLSMAAMVRDMRNRFLVAALFAIPIAIWSPVGEFLFGSTPPTPFGIGDDLWQFFLSLPVIVYSSWIFFRGAFFALKGQTLDMMVLVAVAISAGWIYSVAATFWIEGDVFYEATAFLATFVLLGHWFEMRARGGASGAIRVLLDLAPPQDVVIRDGQEREVPTVEVEVGDLLLIRPGAKVPVDAEVVEGESSVDESTVTGESLPVSKKPGDTLVGATINKQGTLRARATAVGSDTALAQIVKLGQEAQNSKAPAQRLADRAAFWLVLVALIGGARPLFFLWGGVGRGGGGRPP